MPAWSSTRNMYRSPDWKKASGTTEPIAAMIWPR